MDNHQLINSTSGLVEYFTPPNIVEVARSTMGSITLDPASSKVANQHIKATKFCSEEDDGLLQHWRADTLWMNHPFGRREEVCLPDCARKVCLKRGWHRLKFFAGNGAWIKKLTGHFEAGDIDQACCITYASTSEAWFKPLLWYPQCFLIPRTSYLLPDGSVLQGNSKGSCVTYLGQHTDRFHRHFSKLGVVKIPYQSDVALRRVRYGPDKLS